MPPPASSLLWDGAAFVPDAALPVSDRAVRYGMSLFETLRVRAGRAERVAPHLATLRDACATARFPDPAIALGDAWTRLANHALPALIPEATREDKEAGTKGTNLSLVSVAGCSVGRVGQSGNHQSSADTADPTELKFVPFGAGTARIYITAGDGAPDGPVLAPRLFLWFEGRPLPAADRPPLAVRGSRVSPAPHPAGTKSGAYWTNAHALARSRAEGFDEAFLANADGSLRSACMANVFVRLDGRWLTPAAAAHGARPGTVRAWLLDRGFGAEATVPAWRADDAESAFLTNSWIGIAPVGRIGARTLAVPDEVRELAAAFDAVVE